MIWHSSEIDDVLSELSVDKTKGLANGEADMRLEQYGHNVIENIEKPTFIKRFVSQINTKSVYILTVVALICFVVSLVYKQNNFYSPLLIIAIIVLNALISAYNLYKGDTALNSLKSVTNPEATVLRDGIVKQIMSDELVAGDIILLKEGDYITADARLIETNGFRCNEFSLTGESVPVDKNAEITVEDITPIEGRTNMIFSGCNVVHGTAKAVVTATGLETEIGHTSSIIQQTGADKLPLQGSLDTIGKLVNTMIIIVCVIAFFIGLIQNFKSTEPFATMTLRTMLNSVALAVATIPEGLPAISTVVIALGLNRIIRDGIIIKKTEAIEMLGKTTVICSDKTGILTRNKMTLSCIYDGEQTITLDDNALDEKSAMALRLAATCSTLDNDSTEQAIKNACIKYNSMSQNDIENAFPRVGIIPFDSERKTMTSINIINGKPFAIVKGAPEMLIEKCNDCDIKKILEVNNSMAQEALRVVCIAIRPLNDIPANPTPESVEQDLTFVGLLGLVDPPRKEAIDGISSCERAGIRTVMITGDNILTAKAVARRIGILKDGTEAISGSDLALLSDEELKANINKYSVFARITPDDKLRIVKAFKENGEIVTVTGENYNDSDVLLNADVGCAMGRLGTDIAKGNADIIISNNNFISIVRAIKESRGLFANIRKSVTYLLSCNFAEIITYIVGMLIFGAPPLAAVQLLWINLLTDCAPAISLSKEKAENGVMLEKPTTGRIFSWNSVFNITIEAIYISLITVLAYFIGVKWGVDIAVTMAFATIGTAQIFHSFNIRTTRSVLNKIKPNKFMRITTVITLFIMFFAVLTPVGTILGLKVLNTAQFFISLGLAFSVIPFCEIFKIIRNI
ncbi:MAG: cation-translocating P-type ATPase [Clostridia bacterium]|nr:cation-translocating P-type ATPase [Clostridia bacterium]